MAAHCFHIAAWAFWRADQAARVGRWKLAHEFERFAVQHVIAAMEHWT